MAGCPDGSIVIGRTSELCIVKTYQPPSSSPCFLLGSNPNCTTTNATAFAMDTTESYLQCRLASKSPTKIICSSSLVKRGTTPNFFSSTYRDSRACPSTALALPHCSTMLICAVFISDRPQTVASVLSASSVNESLICSRHFSFVVSTFSNWTSNASLIWPFLTHFWAISRVLVLFHPLLLSFNWLSCEEVTIPPLLSSNSPSAILL